MPSAGQGVAVHEKRTQGTAGFFAKKPGFKARIAAAILVCQVSVPHAGDKKPTYVGQNLIDAQIERAFYLLTSVSDPASGITMDKAIASAKEIAAKLRTIAANDANTQYILWKVGELEGQIYLEEKGLLLEKEQFRQKSVNDLIPQFNAELGRRRPDFASLWNLHAAMASIDQRAAVDIENSIRKRAQALAKEVPYFLEENINKGDIPAAHYELAYCRVNREYLGLTMERYASLEAVLAARTSMEDERSLVVSSLEAMKRALENDDMAVANRENRFLKEKIASLRSRMLSYEWTKLNSTFKLYSGKLEYREDELAESVMQTLKDKGPSEASARLDTLRSRGVSREKVSLLDHSILETVIAQKQKESGGSSPVTVPATEAGDKNTVADELMEAARKRAAERNDSIAAAGTERSRITQTEAVRRERLLVAENLRSMREKEKRTTNRQVALQELVDIYTAIELHRPADAVHRFSQRREFIKRNIPAQDFKKVALAIDQQKDAAGK